MDYKISVIIPLYNAEKYLEEAIKSVIKQTMGFSNLQLLICDDCSTDNSFSIARDLEKKYDNVQVFSTDRNTGSASVPRNVCLEHVQAPFVMFLDNDDLLPKTACEILYSVIVESDYDFVCGCYEEVHYNRKHRRSTQYDSVGEREFNFPNDALVFRSIADPFWTKIFRTQIIRDNNLTFDADVYGEDTIFMLKYMVCSGKAKHIKDIVYSYRIRDNSLFHLMNKEHFVGVIHGDEIIRSVLLERGYVNYWNSFLKDHVCDFLDVIANSGMPDMEIREVITTWFDEIKEASLIEMPAKTPYGEIIFRDALRNDVESVVRNMISIHRICSSKNVFAEDLLNSKSWKTITKLNQLLGK